MIKNIFIDLDDTLWATQLNNRAALSDLYDEEGWGHAYPSFDHFFDRYAPHNELLWKAYREGTITKHQLTISRLAHPLEPLQITDEAEILQLNQRVLSKVVEKRGIEEGALELLDYLQSHYRKVVVVSNGFEEVQEKKMAGSGILPYIDHTVLSERAGYAKPHPQIFRLALSLSGSRAQETIFIGDSWEADIVGAQATGIATIWYNPLRIVPPNPTPHFRHPHFEVAHLSEVPPVLRSLYPIR